MDEASEGVCSPEFERLDDLAQSNLIKGGTMRRPLLPTGVFAFLMSLMMASPLAAQRVKAWLVDSLIKVFPSDAPNKNRLKTPEIWAARNQHASVQLAVRAAQPLTGLSAEVEPLRGPGGATIAAWVRPVGYVVVGTHTQDTPPDELVGEAPGWYPDPLPDFPIDVQARRTHALWVSVPVPADATPGLYRGAVHVRAGGRTLARATFGLRVVAATVPQERTLKITNWFWLGDKVSRQFYNAPIHSPDWWTLVENVAKFMADHRQNVVLTPLMDLTAPHVEAGQLRYDFSNFNRWVETFQRAGVIGYIEGSHLLGRSGESYQGSLQAETFQVVDGQPKRGALPVDDPRVEAFLASFLSALNAHLEAKKWKSIYFQHILDEAHGPEPPHYARFAALVRRHLPGVPTMDAVDAAEMPAELQANCDIWVPQLGRFDHQMELLNRRLESGREVWFYTCLVPNQRYLNRLMDYPLLKVRLLHWFNFRYGLAGYLHWGWNYWTPEPMKATQPIINANTTLLPAGDAFIVYPDPVRKSVFSSIRQEAMLEGIEDYELLRLLKQKDPAEAERLAKAAVGGFTDYVRDHGAFRALQRQSLEALSKH